MINAKYSNWKSIVRDGLQAYIWIAGVGIAVIAYIQKDVVSAVAILPAKLDSTVTWIGGNGWVVVFGLTATGALAKLFRDKFNADWTWSLIQELVDRIAQEAFGKLDGHRHFHRATLFRHQMCWWIWPFRSGWWPWGWGRWPGSGWLVPVVRSGHATQKSRTVFLAPDDADRTEGVAGAVWASGKEVPVECSGPVEKGAGDEQIAEYCMKTLVSEAWLRRQIQRGRVMAASFRGIPIEVKGRNWGVLLLDSRDPKGAINATLNMTNHAYVLGKLLERT